MLRTMLSYIRGVELDARWAVIAGDAEFFEVTKRIHNFLHGSPGDGGALGARERRTYERVLEANVPGLFCRISPGDLVVLHDPQTAGLVQPLQEHGCVVAWRSHIGADQPSDYMQEAWSFIEPYVREANRLIFSRSVYIPGVLADCPTAIVAPSIDPFAPKNHAMDPDTVHAILVSAGLLRGGAAGSAPVFRSLSGEPAYVHRRAELLDGGPPPDPDRPIVLQVSRWDRLKDHLGVMDGFVHRTLEGTDAELLLAGPQTGSVIDDPEAPLILGELLVEHAKLPDNHRRRVHVASLPTADLEENAAIVNALQRHATIVTQKSIAEGFGLTVTEAMWKNRPMIASAVGGICQQVCDQRTGILLGDPLDLNGFGDAVMDMLSRPDRAREFADAGREHVRDNFLHDRHLGQYLELLGPLQAEGNHSRT